MSPEPVNRAGRLTRLLTKCNATFETRLNRCAYVTTLALSAYLSLDRQDSLATRLAPCNASPASSVARQSLCCEHRSDSRG
jgi:hypothetical protein